MFEKPNNLSSKAAETVNQFLTLSRTEYLNEDNNIAFESLENILLEAGFTLGSSGEVIQILNDDHLLCRSESTAKVLDLLELGTSISMSNTSELANMCVMASGRGFKIAMQEGFSGREVGNIVKVVVSFRGDHISDRAQIKSSDNLWETKPQTAQVSLIGQGEINLEDIEMISFRFPVRYFPSTDITEDEREALEEENIKFIVRHYIKERKKIAH